MIQTATQRPPTPTGHSGISREPAAGPGQVWPHDRRRAMMAGTRPVDQTERRRRQNNARRRPAYGRRRACGGGDAGA
jgi:hypothetical protein